MKSFFQRFKTGRDTSVSEIEKVGDEFNFLSRKCKLEKDGAWIQPGNYIQQILKTYEEQIGEIKSPAVSIRQLNSEEALREQEKISLFRNIGQERYGVAFSGGTGFKMLQECHSNGYVISSLEKISRILKKTIEYCLVGEHPQAGEGYVKKGESYWCLETFPDSDWSGNTSHRKSPSGGFHALNSCPLFSSSRTQKIISLSSCEAELRAIVSSASDGIYIRSVLEFFSWGKGGPLHLHRFFECAPTCDEGRSGKSKTCGWNVVMDSEQEGLQDGTSTNR